MSISLSSWISASISQTFLDILLLSSGIQELCLKKVGFITELAFRSISDTLKSIYVAFPAVNSNKSSIPSLLASIVGQYSISTSLPSIPARLSKSSLFSSFSESEFTFLKESIFANKSSLPASSNSDSTSYLSGICWWFDMESRLVF